VYYKICLLLIFFHNMCYDMVSIYYSNLLSLLISYHVSIFVGLIYMILALWLVLPPIGSPFCFPSPEY
jgi:hypothetical protein